MDVSRAGAQGRAPKGIGAAAVGGRLAAFHSKGGTAVQITPHVNSRAHGRDKENVATFLSRMAIPFMNTDRSNQGRRHPWWPRCSRNWIRVSGDELP
jgi:hypothetical protein